MKLPIISLNSKFNLLETDDDYGDDGYCIDGFLVLLVRREAFKNQEDF